MKINGTYCSTKKAARNREEKTYFMKTQKDQEVEIPNMMSLIYEEVNNVSFAVIRLKLLGEDL